MAESLSSPSGKAGLPPGALVHVGAQPQTAGRVTLISYGPDHCIEREVHTVDDILAGRREGDTAWVHCEGLDIAPLLSEIGARFQVHPLVLEDILNTHQRPKFEEIDNCLFIVLKTLRVDGSQAVQHEQISLLVFPGLLITFRERRDDLFDSLSQRLVQGRGRIRNLGSDYLAYVVMDSVVDRYFTLTDALEETIEAVEAHLLGRPRAQTFATIQRLRRELVFIRKAIVPLRELLTALLRSDTELIGAKTGPYFRDVFDHVIRVIETLDSYRDLINGMLEIYLSAVSNRMNEVMKVLTIISTIFIPLSFIAGIYGMNFEHMPELAWRFGYPLVWLIFLAVAATMLLFFRRRKWI